MQDRGVAVLLVQVSTGTLQVAPVHLAARRKEKGVLVEVQLRVCDGGWVETGSSLCSMCMLANS
jgi:endonuclease/exonuclease/phosphatase family metal-dependent hydrolase